MTSILVELNEEESRNLVDDLKNAEMSEEELDDLDPTMTADDMQRFIDRLIG
ncbi:MAG: hypothetical protein GY757_09940 [bacterium]|nr:hypothetical protein [bacterium]